MIRAAYIFGIFALILGVVAALPDYPLPTGISDALTLVWSYINLFSFIFPVDTLLQVLLLALLYHTIFFLYDVSMWAVGILTRT